MIKQIKIIFDSNQTEVKKGDFFENLMRDVFESQRYKITQRVNFTGMEIDLMAEHLDRDETAYIECKAKEKLESNEIRTFAFNVRHHEAKFGFFLSTAEYAHQVAGLIKEMKSDSSSRYSNLYFWGPDKIIELLESSQKIKPLDIVIKDNDIQITKAILTYTAVGVFYVLILSEGSLPTCYSICSASNPSADIKEKDIELLKAAIPDIKDLAPFKPMHVYSGSSFYETVAEIQESEDWTDYKPASSKHFVGRTDLRNDLFKFLKLVNQNQTSRRVFYIDGKSGWGKSSLINDLKGRCANKQNRNKYFVLALDTRSANTGNFVALAFKKLIESAYLSGFIKENLFSNPTVAIPSTYDILASDSVKQLLKNLEGEGKTLVIVFDQFEDVFRKVDLFRAFHKFLLDVNDARTSLVVGFSWKSEISIPISHESYGLWQQSKDIAHCLSLREFNPAETNGVIKQFEKAINKSIDIGLKRKLIESSQGFPWLIKKLCIHAYKQIQQGVTMQELVDQDLNCEALFKNDLQISPEETKALKFIAHRSYEGNFFDATEIDEMIPNAVLEELIHKRLVVKSGTKYNAYWDIFRDYIVTDKVPPIGESYLLRQYAKVCIDVLKLFDAHKVSLAELSLKYSRGNMRTLDNILRELRNVGLVKKDGDYFQRSRQDIQDDKNLKEFLRVKLDKHTAYIRLRDSEQKVISSREIVSTFRQIVKLSFAEKTWNTYGKYFVSWLNFVGLDFNGRLSPSLKKGVRSFDQYPNRDTFTPQARPQKLTEVFSCVVNKSITDFQKKYHELYDLKALGLISYTGHNISLTNKGITASKKIGTDELNKLVASEALQTKKIGEAVKFLSANPTASRNELAAALSHVLDGISSGVYKKQTINILFAWAKFVVATGIALPDRAS